MTENRTTIPVRREVVEAEVKIVAVNLKPKRKRKPFQRKRKVLL